MKENCYISWTSDDIDMKLGPVTKLGKKNKTLPKDFNDDLMSEKCDVFVISGRIVCKTYISININLLSY